MYGELRESDPVHHVAYGLTTTYGERELIGMEEARPIVMMDPPEHTAFRRLVARGFTPRRVASLEPMVRRWVVERLDAIRGEDEVDIVETLFKPLLSMVVAHYLGVPDGDRARFDRWTEAIVEANADGDVRLAAGALDDLLGYFLRLIELRRTDPGDDALSDLVGAGIEQDSAPLLQILGFAFTMVAGGNDTTTGFLGHATVELAGVPEQRAELVKDRSLLAGAVEELLRLASPVQGLARTATTGVELHGRTIPAGRKVLLLYGSANRDPREFGADADRATFAPGNYVRRHRSLPFRPNR